MLCYKFIRASIVAEVTLASLFRALGVNTVTQKHRLLTAIRLVMRYLYCQTFDDLNER